MIKCLVTGCALIHENRMPGMYRWGDMHQANGAFIFNACGEWIPLTQLNPSLPSFTVMNDDDSWDRRDVYILTGGIPNEHFLKRQMPQYNRQRWGVAFSDQDRLVGPFFSEQGAEDANRDWGGDGVVEIITPLDKDRELAEIRRMTSRKVQTTPTGRIVTNHTPTFHELPKSPPVDLRSEATGVKPPWEE